MGSMASPESPRTARIREITADSSDLLEKVTVSLQESPQVTVWTRQAGQLAELLLLLGADDDHGVGGEAEVLGQPGAVPGQEEPAAQVRCGELRRGEQQQGPAAPGGKGPGAGAGGEGEMPGEGFRQKAFQFFAAGFPQENELDHTIPLFAIL